MKKPIEPKSIVQPLVDELKKLHQRPPTPAPTGPPKPAESDQDPGGGYNPDHTLPQS